IVAHSKAPVLVVEGEKDVHTLEQIGLLATCNPGGVGMGWLPAYSRILMGRRIVVIPDADEAGRQHAEKVLGSLLSHGAQSLRLVELPDLPEHGDVSDYLENHTRDDLIREILEAPEWAPRG